jgi:uncharacterized membrane protein|tara:strand:+ start:1870 stop:2262 length:393 start_codon:yes stop_codon:yes gene_type:complete
MNQYFYLFFLWIHNMSAGVWLGGSILYLIKSLKYRDKKITSLDFINDYNSILLVSSITLFLSGVIIAFDRLTYGGYTSSQGILLLTKVMLSFIVLFLTWNSRHQTKANKINPSLFISMIIYLIASLLSIY